MKTPQEKMNEYEEIRNEIWKIFDDKGYSTREMAGPLSNIIVELCIRISQKPMVDIETICKTMIADVENMVKAKSKNNERY